MAKKELDHIDLNKKAVMMMLYFILFICIGFYFYFDYIEERFASLASLIVIKVFIGLGLIFLMLSALKHGEFRGKKSSLFKADNPTKFYASAIFLLIFGTILLYYSILDVIVILSILP